MNTPVVLITGALSGIGRATALAFAEQHATVVVAGRHDEAGAALADDLRDAGAKSAYVHADVRHDDEVAGLVDGTVKRFGRIDVAVNNAGTEGVLAPLEQQTAETFNQVFETNVLGTLLCLKHEMRVMVPQHGGSIINLSSVAGHAGLAQAAVYVASKHAVEGLTRSAALEGAEAGVRVNAVAPGPVQTAMYDRTKALLGDELTARIPMGRAGTPDEIADAAVFLGSDRAAFITGQVLTVDGGMTAS